MILYTKIKKSTRLKSVIFQKYLPTKETVFCIIIYMNIFFISIALSSILIQMAGVCSFKLYSNCSRYIDKKYIHFLLQQVNSSLSEYPDSVVSTKLNTLAAELFALLPSLNAIPLKLLTINL